MAENLAAEAAAFVRGRRAEVFGISRAGDGDGAVRAKSSPTDPVTVVDTDTERLLRDRLAQLRPGDPILGEEGGGPADVTATPSDRVTWVLDPIDGTVNFVYGIPAYAVSIGAQVGGITVAGAVADVAARTVYSAATGLGAHLTDERGRHVLRCTGVDELSMALLGTGFGYSVRCREKQAELLAHVVPLVRDVRRIGSAALDLCMVAAGRLDAYYEHGVQVWDSAACKAWLLAQPYLVAGVLLVFYTATGRYVAAFGAVLVLAVLMLAWVVVALNPGIASPESYSLPLRRLLGLVAAGLDVSLIPVMAYLVGLFAWVLNR